MMSPENNTRNTFYLKNLYSLHNILSKAGLEVRFGSINDEVKAPEVITIEPDKSITLEPINKKDHGIIIHNDDSSVFRPCAILLNNDLSVSRRNAMKDIDQHRIPPLK